MSIFQPKVQHASSGSSGREIVPSNPYDISVMVVNHVPFPRSEENEPEEEQDKGVETGYVYSEESIVQSFRSNGENDNGPPDQEEYTTEEVQAFHHVSTQYFINGGLSDANKGGSIESSRDELIVSSKGNYSTMTTEKIGEYVVRELKKLKVSLSAHELLKDPTIRGVVLGSLEKDMLTKQKGTLCHIDVNTFKEVFLDETSLGNYVLIVNPQGWETEEILMLYDMPIHKSDSVNAEAVLEGVSF